MATLSSISLTVGSNPIIKNNNTTFQVIATYSDGTTRNVTDSCDYSFSVNNIVSMSGIELWVNSDIWNNNDEW